MTHQWPGTLSWPFQALNGMLRSERAMAVQVSELSEAHNQQPKCK